MGIQIEWSEDKTKATISKEDLEKLQANFDKGYGKGIEQGKKEVLKHLSFLDVNEENFAEKIGKMKQTLTDLQNGKIPEDIKAKLKDMDLVKDLQQKLEEKQKALEKVQNEFVSFKKRSLIDGKLLELAQKSNAIDPNDVAALFKQNYIVELTDDEKIVVKNQNGNVMFTETGDEMGLEHVFEKFSKEKAHLFKATDRGGSGGGGAGIPAGVTLKDLKADENKLHQFIQTHGMEAYKKLVDAELAQKQEE